MVGSLPCAPLPGLHSGSPELYIGGSGQNPFLHFDSYHTHAFLASNLRHEGVHRLLRGPDSYIYVSPKQYNASQIPDIENPDLNQFPLFANAVPMRFRSIPEKFSSSPAAYGTPPRC